MAGDPFGLLLRQRIIFLGGEVRRCVAGGHDEGLELCSTTTIHLT
jgi:hypothetical protein